MGYKAVLIILYDCKNRLLLQHRSENTSVLPGHWAFFGGGVKPGETLREAIYRETLEELNYKLKDPQLFMEQDFKINNFFGRMYVYIENFTGDKSGLQLREGQGWGWYSREEIDSLKMIEHDRRLIKSLCGYLENKYYEVLRG